MARIPFINKYWKYAVRLVWLSFESSSCRVVGGRTRALLLLTVMRRRFPHLELTWTSVSEERAEWAVSHGKGPCQIGWLIICFNWTDWQMYHTVHHQEPGPARAFFLLKADFPSCYCSVTCLETTLIVTDTISIKLDWIEEHGIILLDLKGTGCLLVLEGDLYWNVKKRFWWRWRHTEALGPGEMSQTTIPVSFWKFLFDMNDFLHSWTTSSNNLDCLDELEAESSLLAT